MNMIYRFFGYTKYNANHINSSVLIQKKYKDFRKQQDVERIKLIKSIENTFNTNEHTVISEIKNGDPIVYKETIYEKSNINDEIDYYLNERKRIKNNSPKEN